MSNGMSRSPPSLASGPLRERFEGAWNPSLLKWFICGYVRSGLHIRAFQD